MYRGEIFLYSGRGLVPWLVKKVTKSKWNHAGWVFRDRVELDADEGGVEIEPFSYDMERCAFISLRVPEAKIEECLKYVEGKVGKKYDYKLFFGLFWRWLWGWRRKKDVDDWGSGYICSELVAKPVMMFTGIHFNPDVALQNIVPQDIWQFAVMNPRKAEITYLGSKVRG